MIIYYYKSITVVLMYSAYSVYSSILIFNPYQSLPLLRVNIPVIDWLGHVFNK